MKWVESVKLKVKGIAWKHYTLVDKVVSHETTNEQFWYYCACILELNNVASGKSQIS